MDDSVYSLASTSSKPTIMSAALAHCPVAITAMKRITMLSNTCINHLCTQLSWSQQSLTNLKQCALLNHKPDVNNDVLINPCISRDMIKSVHNEIGPIIQTHLWVTPRMSHVWTV